MIPVSRQQFDILNRKIKGIKTKKMSEEDLYCVHCISTQKAHLTYYHDSILHEKLPDFKWNCIAFIGDETRKLESFECKLCNAKFRTFHILKRHIDTIHDLMKMFTCESCNYSSCQEEDLENHVCTSIHVKNNHTI